MCLLSVSYLKIALLELSSFSLKEILRRFAQKKNRHPLPSFTVLSKIYRKGPKCISGPFFEARVLSLF